MDYLRATLTPGPNGVPVATPLPIQDSLHDGALWRKADCLLIREAHAPALRAGSGCPIVKLRF